MSKESALRTVVGKAFRVEGIACTKATGGNAVSKRKSGGNEVRKAAWRTSGGAL